MKKLGAIALTLALAGTLTIPALADGPDGPRQEELIIAPAPSVHYSTALTLNGKELDTSAIPAAPAPDLVPMRLMAESDHGSAEWYQEEGMGAFYLDGYVITVTFATGEVAVNDEVVEGAAGVLKAGVTFLPVDVIDDLEGYTAEVFSGAEADRIEITTPNSAPLVKAAYDIMDASGMAYGMKADAQILTEGYQIPADQFEQVTAFFPMITSPDTVLIGKLKADADVDAVTAALETYRQNQEDTFSWYLPQNLPKVEDARLLVEEGYVFFLIAEDADAGVEAFRAFAAGQE